MEQLDPADLLRFLQHEADTLQQMQSKISNELHHLQVEEEVFVRTINRLNENANNGSSRDGEAQERIRGATGKQAGLELVEALQTELALVPPGPLNPEPLQAQPEAPPKRNAQNKAKALPKAKAAPPASLSEMMLMSSEDEYELLNGFESEDAEL